MTPFTTVYLIVNGPFAMQFRYQVLSEFDVLSLTLRLASPVLASAF
jgi:hypothetical protein